MLKTLKFVLVATAVATLVACGGGGGGGSETSTAVVPTLSVTQQNFETSAIADSYVAYSWFLPTTNVVPTSGTHYMYTDRFSVQSSPSSGAKTVTQVTTNFATTLALPIMAQQGVDRVLKSGVIYASNHDGKGEYSYVGSDVVATTYATDGITPVYASVYDSWSVPIPLTGQIGNTTVLKSFLGFTRLTASTVNFDFSQSWLSGSNYITRKGYRKSDTLFIWDWTGNTYNSAVTAYTGTETTIETFFANAGFLAAGGVTVDGVVYPISAGTISTIEGARAWIANAKRPTSASATDSYVVFFELNGKIYIGNLQKAGVRFRFIDGVDATIVNDYNIRMNSTAAAAMKQAIKF